MKPLKTLVIHPDDRSTDFLKEIYEDHPEWDVAPDKISKKELKLAIKSHDRIIMLGHGSDRGLIDFKNNRFIINSELVYLLLEKEVVMIWCNSDLFFKKYKLHGFYTGMIVSEYEEAMMYSVDCYFSDIEASNKLFSSSIKAAITEPNMLEVAKSLYITENNNVIHFNKHNLYYDGILSK